MTTENTLGRTRTEAVMSLNFDSCHRAAAEASKAAIETMRTGEVSLQTVNVIDVLGRRQLEGLDFGWQLFGNPYNSRGYTGLVLAQEVTEQTPEPQLLAILRDDIALPLAYFNERKDGACSYVRIGQEMRDESFVVTPRDERATVIMALRKIIESGQSRYSSLSDVERAAVKSLLSQEIEAHAEQIDAQLAPALASQLQKTYARNKFEQPLRVRSMDGSAESTLLHSQVFDSWPITLEDGREVELMLTADEARPADAKNWRPARLQLIAVARGDLAWNVLSFEDGGVFDALTGSALLSQDIDTLRSCIALSESRRRYENMQTAKDKLTPKRVGWLMRKVRSYESESTASAKEFAALCSVIYPEAQLEYCIRKAELDDYEERSLFFGRTLTDGGPTHENVTTACRNGMPGKFWRDITALEKYAEAFRMYYLERKKLSQNPETLALAELVGRTNLAARIEQHLGPHRPQAELLLKRVHELSLLGTLFEGVWKEAPLAQHTSDIDIKIDISRPESEQLRVEVGTRPSAEDDLPHEPTFDVLFDRLAQLKVEDGDIAELQHHLDLVVPVKPPSLEKRASQRVHRLISQLLARHR